MKQKQAKLREAKHLVKAMEANNGPDGRTSVPISRKISLPPVSPFSSGKGLPYAPVNWPNAGDIWGWKVGGRFGIRCGYFFDRFLIVPAHLKDPIRRGRLVLEGRPQVIRFLQERFPDADIDSFFDSFSWKIPARGDFIRKKVSHTRLPSRKFGKLTSKVGSGGSTHRQLKQKQAKLGRWTRRSSRMMARTIMKYSEVANPTVIDLCSETESEETNTNDATAIDSVNCQSNSPHATYSARHDSIAASLSHEKVVTEEIPMDFDDYLNSLSGILAQPPTGFPFPPPSVSLTEDMAGARKRLSEILGTDLRVLLSSKDLITEMVALSLKLQKGSSFQGPAYSVLKLIDEIPARIKHFEQAKKVTADSVKFFADLEANIARATTLKNEYNESKSKVALLQTNINSESMVLENIHEQISNLQARRDQATTVVEEYKREIAVITSKQRMVSGSGCLPNVVQRGSAGSCSKF